MNQRPVRGYKAAPTPGEGNITLGRLKEFASEAARLLEEAEQDDAAFYFEQLAEHIQRHPEKGLNESVARILGI